MHPPLGGRPGMKRGSAAKRTQRPILKRGLAVGCDRRKLFINNNLCFYLTPQRPRGHCGVPVGRVVLERIWFQTLAEIAVPLRKYSVWPKSPTMATYLASTSSLHRCIISPSPDGLHCNATRCIACRCTATSCIARRCTALHATTCNDATTFGPGNGRPTGVDGR
jgi:hypothetical protein